MYTTTSPTERTTLATAAAALAALGLSFLVSGFLPADPNVSEARGRAILERVEHARPAHPANEPTLAVATAAGRC